MNFKKWLFEVGDLGGVTHMAQKPASLATAMQDFHGPEAADPENPNGMLPSTKKPTRKVYNPNGKRRPRTNSF